MWKSIFTFLTSDIHRIHISENVWIFLCSRSSHALRICFRIARDTETEHGKPNSANPKGGWDRSNLTYVCSNTTVIDRAYPNTRLKSLNSIIQQLYNHPKTPESWANQSTHLPLDKMAAISQTAFWNALSWIKRFLFVFELHWSLIVRDQLPISQHGIMNNPIFWKNFQGQKVEGQELSECRIKIT